MMLLCLLKHDILSAILHSTWAVDLWKCVQHEVIENVRFRASNFRLIMSREELGFKDKDEKTFQGLSSIPNTGIRKV